MPTEHGELLDEMQDVERLPTAERLKLARKRRLQQLKKYAEYDKKLEKQEKTTNKKNSKNLSGPPLSGLQKERVAKLVFADSIVFLDAAARNDLDEVRALLERGVNPDVANEDGLTALHQCAIDDGVELAALLLDHGANVNTMDSEMWTPLHAAATCGHLRICQKLVQGGANLLAVNADGNMPYDICEDEATLEFVETEMANTGVTQELIDRTRLCHSHAMLTDMQALSESGIDLESKDRNGVVPLHIASANGYYNVVLYLLEKGVAVDPADSDGWTPVHAAACWGQVAIVEILAKFGADLEATTARGETLLDICEDPDLKHQIEEIKRMALTDKERHRDPFVQRRSSSHNTRGASIRRHSMREKQRLSLKEAKEEARMFAADKDDGAVTSPDDVDVVDTPPNHENSSDRHVAPANNSGMPGAGEGDEASHNHEAKDADRGLGGVSSNGTGRTVGSNDTGGGDRRSLACQAPEPPEVETSAVEQNAQPDSRPPALLAPKGPREQQPNAVDRAMPAAPSVASDSAQQQLPKPGLLKSPPCPDEVRGDHEKKTKKACCALV